MKIYLVDDNDKFRKGLKLFLEKYHEYEIVGEDGDGESLLLSNWQYADIILMDINMPNTNGIQASKFCKGTCRRIKVIAISQFKDEISVKQLVCAGFSGFVNKNDIFEELAAAIEKVYAGGYYFPSYLHTE